MTRLAPATVIIPAHNEGRYISACLDAVLRSDLVDAQVEVIVVANGCDDATAEIARQTARQSPCPMHVVETPIGDKLHALRLGDEAAVHGTRIYLDADVIVGKALIAGLAQALSQEAAHYASGTPRIAPARSAVTRAYARFWQTLPFVQDDVPGFGIFAVNAAGRDRWGDWPTIISDDTFVRLHFASDERAKLGHPYAWPMVEGFRNLVRVRRRQNHGVQEIAERFPALLENDSKARIGFGGLLRRALRDPAGFVVYAAVALAVKLPGEGGWVRGR